MLSGGSKGNIGKKMVSSNHELFRLKIKLKFYESSIWKKFTGVDLSSKIDVFKSLCSVTWLVFYKRKTNKNNEKGDFKMSVFDY